MEMERDKKAKKGKRLVDPRPSRWLVGKEEHPQHNKLRPVRVWRPSRRSHRVDAIKEGAELVLTMSKTMPRVGNVKFFREVAIIRDYSVVPLKVATVRHFPENELPGKGDIVDVVGGVRILIRQITVREDD